ncbi:MAG: HU family DNA-binding protein [Paludibacteraceae bacterium]|nr:HU family DNA-binding protein [Paludibacteraceae bacterium]
MSNEKLSIQDLVDAIAQRTGYSKKRSDDFLRVLQTTIEEGLIKDGLVKIKGFGTFKLVWNEARKSVNVQTGKEYIIPGHNKVSFIPEAIVKDTINESSTPVSGVKPPINPLEKLNEQAEEIKIIISELKDLVPDAEGTNGSIDLIEAPAMPLEKGDDLVAEEAKKAEVITETKPIEKKEDNKEAKTPVVAPVAETQAASEPQKTHERDLPVKKKKRVWILAIVIVFALLVAGGVYVEFQNVQFFFTHLMDDYDAPHPTKKAQPIVAKQPVLVTARKQLPAKDTVKAVQPKQQSKAVEKKAVQTPVVTTKPQPKVDNTKSNTKKVATEPKIEQKTVQKAEPKAQKSNKTSIFDKPRVYKTFICIETIEKGSHLTLIAQKYYGYKTFWVYIYEANKDKISNPESLPVGFKVKVPKLDAELIDLKNPTCKKYAQELEAKYVQK